MVDDNLKILKTLICTWSDAEINKAWGMIAQEGERRQKARADALKSSLCVGDTVTWNHGSSQGVVVKIKYKKAIIKENGVRHNWDIRLSSLTKIY